MGRTLLILTIAMAGAVPAQSVKAIFSPCFGISYGYGSRLTTETEIYSYEKVNSSGLNVNLGSRLTLVSGRLRAFAQVDFINLDRLFPRESCVAFMVTQSTGWTADILTLDASFRYARTFDAHEYRPRPLHETFGGFAGAQLELGRFDYSLTLGLVHRTGILIEETDLPALLEVTYHLGKVARPGIGLGWTARRIWSYERVGGTPADIPFFLSVGVCFVPQGLASDFPARMLMPRSISYYED